MNVLGKVGAKPLLPLLNYVEKLFSLSVTIAARIFLEDFKAAEA